MSKKLFLAPALLLLFASCKKDHSDPSKEKQFNLTGFSQVYASEKINLVIRQGAAFNIKARGPIDNVDSLDLKLTDNGATLDIAYKDGAVTGVAEVTITLPQLETAFLSGDVTATVGGFTNQVGTVGLIVSGKAKVTVNDGANIFGIDITGNAQLNLNGAAASLAGWVSLNAVVNAYGLTATRVHITTTHHAKAYVKPTNIFFGSAANESRIYYKGNPQDKEIETSGNGQVIHE